MSTSVITTIHVEAKAVQVSLDTAAREVTLRIAPKTPTGSTTTAFVTLVLSPDQAKELGTVLASCALTVDVFASRQGGAE